MYIASTTKTTSWQAASPVNRLTQGERSRSVLETKPNILDLHPRPKLKKQSQWNALTGWHRQTLASDLKFACEWQDSDSKNYAMDDIRRKQ